MTAALMILALAVVGAVAAALRARDLVSVVIAVDVGVMALIGLLAIDAVRRSSATYLDALPVLGLLAVLATLAAAWVLSPDRSGTSDEPILRGGRR